MYKYIMVLAVCVAVPVTAFSIAFWRMRRHQRKKFEAPEAFPKERLVL